MKKILTALMAFTVMLLVACSNPVMSNARAVISVIEPTTNSVTFKVEIKDPDNELIERDFIVALSGPNDFYQEQVESIPKDQIKTVSFEGLARTSDYFITIKGTTEQGEIELYQAVNPFKTKAQGETEADPLFISSTEAFLSMDQRKHYRLTQDLDFENESITPLFTSGKPFTGSFDGDGFTIKNVEITAENDVYKSYMSIFGFASKSTIKNVNFENITIDNDAKPYVGRHFVGVVVSKVSNNDFILTNITIKNASITIRHNINQSTTNRDLYVGIVGGSLQGTISDVVVTDSSISVLQGGMSGTYSGTDMATVGTYVGGIAGLIEIDKGKGITQLAFIDSEINVDIVQDKKGLGAGLLYVGGIFGAYRSDKNISELVTNASINVNYEKHEETESDKEDVLLVAGLIGSVLKASTANIYFFGNMSITLNAPITDLTGALLIGSTTKSASQALAGGQIEVHVPVDFEVNFDVYHYNSTGPWNKFVAVNILADTTITINEAGLDLSDYEVAGAPADHLTSAFVLGGYVD